MSPQTFFFGAGLVLTGFWLGAGFAVWVLDLAPWHNRQHYRRTAVVNAAVFAVFTAVLWLLR